ncbi:hypothetical protein BT69DRAFT_1285122 [Atractiella rhizophila]|nr:hypothetical protein BT69DRAFT_1285122 [Atractiella rhizophila]
MDTTAVLPALPDLSNIDGSIDVMTGYLELWLQKNCSVLRLDGSKQDTMRIESIEQTMQFLVKIRTIHRLDSDKGRLDFGGQRLIFVWGFEAYR